jgi:plasmid replication initiation protein
MKAKSPEKLQILFTVVTHGKANVIVDALEDMGVNAQFVLNGSGLKGKELKSLFQYSEKDVILSFVSAEKSKEIIKKLEEKFDKIKNSYGVSWAVSVSSIIGVSIYQFLIDYRKGGNNNG